MATVNETAKKSRATVTIEGKSVHVDKFDYKLFPEGTTIVIKSRQHSFQYTSLAPPSKPLFMINKQQQKTQPKSKRINVCYNRKKEEKKRGGSKNKFFSIWQSCSKLLTKATLAASVL